MDHRSRFRGTGLSRIPGSQSRTPRAPLPLHVEQEAREGEEWEQRELPRPRTPTYAPCIYEPPECEELPDNLMGKDKLFPSRQKGGGFIVSSYAHRKPQSKIYNGQDWDEG